MSSTPSRSRRRERDDPRRLRRPGRQQAALGADDARADDRRRLRDRAGRGRHRLVQRRAEADRRAWLTTCCWSPRPPRWAASRGGPTISNSLTLADANALQNRFTAPDVAAPSRRWSTPSGVTLTYGSTTYSPSTFVGTTPSYETAHDYSMADRLVVHQRPGQQATTESWWSGRRWSASCSAARTRSARPSRSTAPTSRSIGVTNSKGSNGTTDQDDVAFAPLTAVQDTLTGYGSINSITVQAKSRDQLNAAQTEVTDILNQLDPTLGGLDRPATSTSSIRARSCRPRAQPAACSRPCLARWRRSRCWSAGSA